MNNAYKINRKQKGFTLIEIIVVMVIIGILAVAVAPSILGRVDDAKIVKAKQDLNAIGNALTLYKLDNNKYPETEEGLSDLTGKYLPRLPKDPWGNDYQYANPGENGDFDLLSFGGDGTAGGDDIDADISLADF